MTSKNRPSLIANAVIATYLEKETRAECDMGDCKLAIRRRRPSYSTQSNAVPTPPTSTKPSVTDSLRSYIKKHSPELIGGKPKLKARGRSSIRSCDASSVASSSSYVSSSSIRRQRSSSSVSSNCSISSHSTAGSRSSRVGPKSRIRRYDGKKMTAAKSLLPKEVDTQEENDLFMGWKSANRSSTYRQRSEQNQRRNKIPMQIVIAPEGKSLSESSVHTTTTAATSVISRISNTDRCQIFKAKVNPINSHKIESNNINKNDRMAVKLQALVRGHRIRCKENIRLQAILEDHKEKLDRIEQQCKKELKEIKLKKLRIMREMAVTDASIRKQKFIIKMNEKEIQTLKTEYDILKEANRKLRKRKSKLIGYDAAEDSSSHSYSNSSEYSLSFSCISSKNPDDSKHTVESRQSQSRRSMILPSDRSRSLGSIHVSPRGGANRGLSLCYSSMRAVEESTNMKPASTIKKQNLGGGSNIRGRKSCSSISLPKDLNPVDEAKKMRESRTNDRDCSVSRSIDGKNKSRSSINLPIHPDKSRSVKMSKSKSDPSVTLSIMLDAVDEATKMQERRMKESEDDPCELTFGKQSSKTRKSSLIKQVGDKSKTTESTGTTMASIRRDDSVDSANSGRERTAATKQCNRSFSAGALPTSAKDKTRRSSYNRRLWQSLHSVDECANSIGKSGKIRTVIEEEHIGTSDDTTIISYPTQKPSHNSSFASLLQENLHHVDEIKKLSKQIQDFKKKQAKETQARQEIRSCIEKIMVLIQQRPETYQRKLVRELLSLTLDLDGINGHTLEADNLLSTFKY